MAQVPAVRQYATIAVSASPTALAYAQAPLAGSHLWMLLYVSAASPAVSGITDTLTNTWAMRHAVTVGAHRFELWSAPCPAGGANTISVTWAVGSPSGRYWIGEITNGGPVSYGSATSLDDTTSGNPVTVATHTTAGPAIVVSILRTDGTVNFVEWSETAAQVGWGYLLGNGSNNFVAWALCGEATSLAPVLRASGATTGESLTASFNVTMPSSGGGFTPLAIGAQTGIHHS